MSCCTREIESTPPHPSLFIGSMTTSWRQVHIRGVSECREALKSNLILSSPGAIHVQQPAAYVRTSWNFPSPCLISINTAIPIPPIASPLATHAVSPLIFSSQLPQLAPRVRRHLGTMTAPSAEHQDLTTPTFTKLNVTMQPPLVYDTNLREQL